MVIYEEQEPLVAAYGGWQKRAKDLGVDESPAVSRTPQGATSRMEGESRLFSIKC